MGFNSCDGEIQVPCIDIKKELLEWKQESEERKELCGKVREACEEYGCFVARYDGVPRELCEEMFMAMKDLFDLPVETKQKNSRPKPYRGYQCNPEVAPLMYESLGIEEPHCLEAAQAFTELMWPQGNPAFCRILQIMSGKMQELQLLILRMILESYGIPSYLDAVEQSAHYVLRLASYKPSPPGDNEGRQSLWAHRDRSFITVLFQNQANGFELLTKQGHWHQLTPMQGSFVVIVGEMMKVLSNGRLHAVEHRVVMRGDTERYSCIQFATPKDGEVIQVASELVDEEHPLVYRPFKYMDYAKYFKSNPSKNALEIYAGV